MAITGRPGARPHELESDWSYKFFVFKLCIASFGLHIKRGLVFLASAFRALF